MLSPGARLSLLAWEEFSHRQLRMTSIRVGDQRWQFGNSFFGAGPRALTLLARSASVKTILRGTAMLGSSHADDVHRFGMSRQGFEVMRVCGQHRASRFGMRNDERVDRGTASSAPPEQGRASGQRLG